MIGKRIHVLREMKKLTQQELANKTGISRISIGNYERGTRTPNATIVKKLANALEIPSSLLLEGHPDLDSMIEITNSPEHKLIENLYDEFMIGNKLKKTIDIKSFDDSMGLSNFKSGTGIPEILGQLIKKKRREEGISSQKLAEMIDIPHQDILKYEDGEMVIPGTILEKMATALKTSSSFLYYDLGFLSSSLENNNDTRDILTQIEQNELYESEKYKKIREKTKEDRPLREEALLDTLSKLDDSNLRIMHEVITALLKEQEKE